MIIIPVTSVNDIIDIREFLAQYRGRHITFIPNDGNAGDHLIAYATLQIFDELGLDYSIGSLGEFDGSLLFYGGGGNLVGHYGNCRDFLYKNKDNNEIVILPHTIREEDWLVSWLGENVTIICRERKSYDYVCRMRRAGTTLLAHDMAFYTRVSESLNPEGILNAFRTDMESTNVIRPPDNIDISETLRSWVWTKEAIDKTGTAFLERIAKHETINTNRLHVAIAGMVIGRQVHLYRNTYWKNKEVYDFSMADNPNVRWAE